MFQTKGGVVLMTSELSQLAEELDKQFREDGWKRVQLGELVLYEKPLPEAVISNIIEIQKRRVQRVQSYWWWHLLNRLAGVIHAVRWRSQRI